MSSKFQVELVLFFFRSQLLQLEIIYIPSLITWYTHTHTTDKTEDLPIVCYVHKIITRKMVPITRRASSVLKSI